MASPKRFEKIDFNMIGSGTGVLRYAFGCYMGEKNTAQKYYDDYDRYGGADKKFYRNGKEMTEGSLGYQMAEELFDERWDITKLKEYYEKYPHMSNRLNALKLITDDFTRIDFQTEYAVMYEVKLPGYSKEDLYHWDCEMPDDKLNEIAFMYYNEKLDMESLSDEIIQKLDELEVYRDVDNAEELFDNLFDSAMEYACEEDTFSCHVDDDIIKEVWDQKVRGDNHYSHQYDHEFNEGIDSKFTDLLSEIIKGGISLEHEMTFGDAYHQLSHSLNSEYRDQDDNIEGKKLASKFLSEKMDYVGFIAESKFGDHGAQEIIIINEKVAKSLSLRELFVNDKLEFKRDNQFEDDFDLC